MILLEFFLYLLVVTVIFSMVASITAYMRFTRQQSDKSPDRKKPGLSPASK